MVAIQANKGGTAGNLSSFIQGREVFYLYSQEGRKMQIMPGYLGYLGPSGTFSEEAAHEFARQAKVPLALQAFSTCREIVERTKAGELAAGILPWENSITGLVNFSLNLLLETDRCLITAEVVVPVSHSFLVRPDTDPARVKAVYSHPQALSQCQQFLDKFFPRAARISTASTAAAAALVAAGPEPMAAIGSSSVARRYGLKIAYEAIQDSANNWTRFVVVAGEDNPAEEKAKTAVVLIPRSHRAVDLPALLGILAENGVPLLNLAVFPARCALGEYFFLIEVEGHRNSPALAKALQQLNERVEYLRILGSFAPAASPSDRHMVGTLWRERER
jgi:prephenate dehydratase